MNSANQENIFQTPNNGSPAVSGGKRTLDSDDDSADDDGDVPRKKKSKRPTASGLGIYRRSIVDHAKPHLRARIVTKNPCPSGTQIDVWLTDAWLSGFREVQDDLKLDKDTLPADNELILVRVVIFYYFTGD
jgi:hypothetical protein